MEFSKDKHQPYMNLEKMISSNIVLKKIFSFLEKTKKLKIIIENKNIQKKIKIDINDYKNASGKYKIGGKNGQVKIFILNTDLLIFEGEYLNGVKNGKGKEYNKKGELIFKGEYLKGIKNGKGKEYNKKKEVIFEGEYINGRRYKGKGKEYDSNSGLLIYEG